MSDNGPNKAASTTANHLKKFRLEIKRLGASAVNQIVGHEAWQVKDPEEELPKVEEKQPGTLFVAPKTNSDTPPKSHHEQSQAQRPDLTSEDSSDKKSEGLPPIKIYADRPHMTDAPQDDRQPRDMLPPPNIYGRHHQI
jgi:hypothetical protein